MSSFQNKFGVLGLTVGQLNLSKVMVTKLEYPILGHLGADQVCHYHLYKRTQLAGTQIANHAIQHLFLNGNFYNCGWRRAQSQHEQFTINSK